MGPAEGSDAAAGRVAHPGAGVVSRPDLARRLGASARVTVVSAPPGSGKSVLLRSWIGEAGLKDSAGWVSVGRDDRDPQRFWLSVLGALRQTSAGSRLVRELVRTHVRHLFAKLGAHGRTEAVERARALGLLAPSGRTT